MDLPMDNPLSDIFDNALDIFSFDYNIKFDSHPLLPKEPSQSQAQLWEEPSLMPLLPEAVYTSTKEAEEAIKS